MRLDLSPMVAAARLAGARGRAVLLSARDDDALGRWSFVGATPVATLEAWGDGLCERDVAGLVIRQWRGDPIAAVEAFALAHGADLRATTWSEAPLPRVLGYLGYDLGRSIERVGDGPTLGNDVPDLWLGAYPAIARWRTGDAHGEVVGDTHAAAALHAQLSTGVDHPGRAPALGDLRGPDDDHALHRARVQRARDYIAAGDVYQVNLARRLVAPVRAVGDSLAVLAAIVATAPAPYGALIDADGVSVISGSPERFLGREGARIETRPIKGTRPRSADVVVDAAFDAELASAEKDGAEHLMIVDLERNDLGRVAVVGSVVVDRLAYGVALPHVHHRVSRVSAQLRPEVGLADLLRATFPGGSITGAPKVRAMQLIDELEPARRGPYCGALGYLGADGDLELAIAIRIAVLTPTELRVHVGGGIVFDSDPDDELAETETKAVGWRRALTSLVTARRDPTSRT